jgi:hypothetical protein
MCVQDLLFGLVITQQPVTVVLDPVQMYVKEQQQWDAANAIAAGNILLLLLVGSQIKACTCQVVRLGASLEVQALEKLCECGLNIIAAVLGNGELLRKGPGVWDP